MSTAIAFASKKSFANWLKKSPREVVARFGFAKLKLPEILVLGTDPVIRLPGEEYELHGCRIHLPETADADDWWEDLWDKTVTDYWVHDDGGAPAVICAARGGVWKPSDTLYAFLQQSDFRMIYDDEFQGLAGESISNEMLAEVREVGFSVRRLRLRK